MKVKDLIEQLQRYDSEAVVVLEVWGIARRSLGVVEAIYTETADAALRIYAPAASAEQMGMGPEEWEDFKNGCCTPCVVVVGS